MPADTPITDTAGRKNGGRALAGAERQGSNTGATKIMRRPMHRHAGREEAAAPALRLQKTEKNDIERLNVCL